MGDGFCFNPRKKLISKSFILKPTEITQFSLKTGGLNFLKIPPFKRLAHFYATTTRDVECFQDFNIETNFLRNESLF